MGKCWNCDKEINLREAEIKCDDCGKIINYKCHNCHQWFSIYDEEKKEKISECKTCGFFYCPNCGVCGINCQKENWYKIIKEILNEAELNEDQKIQKICKLIEDIKIGKEQIVCPRGVSISYAKGRIKRCIIRMKGFRVKDDEDIDKFKERLNYITELPIGEIVTINQSREKGSYGQELRDVFNYCLCLGVLIKIKINKIIDGEEKIYDAWRRVEKGECPKLDQKNLFKMECPNKNCKIKTYPLSQTECCNPECRYKKGKNKGQLRKLKLKISNKEICQLNRGEFKKEEDEKIRNY